jgi:hypothetical protein
LLWQIKKLTIAAMNKKEISVVLRDNKVPRAINQDKAEAVLIAAAAQVSKVLVAMLAALKVERAVSKVDNKVDAVARKAEKNQMFPMKALAVAILTEAVKMSDR